MKENDIIKDSPMNDMRPPRVPREIIQPYTAEQIKILMDNCDDSTFLGARNKALILLFLSTGLRRDEMYKIQLKDVDVTHRTINIMGKGAKGRVVGFGMRASKALMIYYTQHRKQRVKDKCPYLWLSEEGTRLGYSGIGLALSKLVDFCGISGIHSKVHSLRHTFATEALTNGARLYDVQRLLGHETPAMSEKYARTVDSRNAIKNHPQFDPVDKMIGL
jgi:site-specific recombinase XerD